MAGLKTMIERCGTINTNANMKSVKKKKMNPLILCVFTCFILFETSLEIFTRFNKCPFQHNRLLKNNTILCRNTSFFGISFFLGHFLWSAVVQCYVSNFLVELTGTVSIPYKYKYDTHKKERKNHWPNGQPAQC